MPLPPDALDPFTPGAAIGHFRIVRELGRGAFGVVHLAEDRDIPGRVVALKSVRAGKEIPAVSLRDEAAALAAIQHPNILVVHEVGETPSGIVYLVAEFMPGGSLADRLRRGPLTTGEALAVARAAADALAAAHDRGIVHRDFKPGNLLLSADGIVKVADFGIALRTIARTSAPFTASTDPQGYGGLGEATLTLPSDHGRGVAGTPLYIPPELFEGGMATAQGDQFSFGITLHELLAGTNPFGRGAGLRGTLATPSISRAIPRNLRTILARCLERDPEHRYESMRAVVAALDAALASRSVERRRSRRIALIAASVVLVSAFGWLGARIVRERRARTLNERGSAALERGDRDAARAAFVAAHGVDPDFLPACSNLGSLAGLEANPAWAVTILKDCASRFPASDVVRYNLGFALRAAGDGPNAERELRSALELAGPPALHAAAANELALVLVDGGRTDDAIRLLRAERALSPGSVEEAVLTKTTGIALLSAGSFDEAVAELRTSLAGPLPPALRAQALVAQAQALERSGHAAEAAESFAQAIGEGAEGTTAAEAREGLLRVQPSFK